MVQVFMRRVGESLVIGGAIEVTVLGIRDDEVRFAIARRHSGRAEVRVFNAHVRESLVTDDEIEVIVLSVRDGHQSRSRSRLRRLTVEITLDVLHDGHSHHHSGQRSHQNHS